MNPRAGIALMVIGGVIALAGLVWLLVGDFDDEQTTMPTTTTAVAAATTTTVSPPTTTTTVAPATTGAPTTTITAATTTTTQSTTTTTFPAETVEEFLTVFRQALDADDLGFLFDRLHPIAQETYGEDLCRAFPGNEIELFLVTPTDFRRLWATLDLWLAGDGPSPAEVAAERPSSLESLRLAPWSSSTPWRRSSRKRRSQVPSWGRTASASTCLNIWTSIAMAGYCLTK